MTQTLLQNPFLLLTLMCLCWPGILPVVGAFVLARRFNFKFTVSRRDRGGSIDV